MQTVQVSLSLELVQRLQRYRRSRGAQLGIPIIDLDVAVGKLLENGLDLIDEGQVPESWQKAAIRPDSRMQSCAARKLPHLRTIGLDGPHDQPGRDEAGPLDCQSAAACLGD